MKIHVFIKLIGDAYKNEQLSRNADQVVVYLITSYITPKIDVIQQSAIM